MPWVYNASPEVESLSEYPRLLAVCVSLTFVMAVIVGMRFYVRGKILKSFGPDDWTILGSAGCSLIYNALCISQSRWGLGLPVASRPKINLIPYTLLNYPSRPFYMIGITGFKVALCLAYLRIVNRDNRFYRPLIWAIMVTCVLSHLGGTLVLVFQCRPVAKNWHPLTPGYCLPNDTTFYVLAAITIFFDCIIFTLPIPLLAKVQISTRRKIALIGVFVLGLFTTVCSVMRMVQILQITKDGNSTGLVLWGTIEMNVGISLTCIPALTPLFAYFREKTTIARQMAKNTHDTGDSNGTARNTHALERYPKKTPATETRYSSSDLDDRDSEESILGVGRLSRSRSLGNGSHRRDFARSPMGGITRTTELDVKVSSADSNASTEGLRKW